jgi:hypothetical protein
MARRFQDCARYDKLSGCWELEFWRLRGRKQAYGTSWFRLNAYWTSKRTTVSLAHGYFLKLSRLMASPGLEMVECDDAGNVTCLYVETEGSHLAGRSRVDIIVCALQS